MIVVDASAIIDVLVGSAVALDRLSGQPLAAPHVLDVEVGAVLRRLVRRQEIDPGFAREALDDLAELQIDRYAHQPLLSRAWELRDNVTFADALYIALAERLGAAVLTADARLARGSGVRARVEVLPIG